MNASNIAGSFAKRNFHNFVIAITVFCISLFQLLELPVQGIVLCIGNDGHIALEVASGNRGCGQLINIPIDFSEDSQLFDAKSLGMGHCGVCEDFIVSDMYNSTKIIPSHGSEYDLGIIDTFFVLIDYLYNCLSTDNRGYLDMPQLVNPSIIITLSSVQRC